MAASSGNISPVSAANSGKFIAAFCRYLPRAVRPLFLPSEPGRGWCLTKLPAFQFQKAATNHVRLNVLKLDEDGRSEHPFLKSERTQRLWSRGILETDADCAAV
jgi:hypothetical protein